MPAVSPVIVNFVVNVDAASGVTVFGQAAPTIINEVIAINTLSASTLNGLIEFWEPSTAIGTMQSHLDLELVGAAGSQIASYKASALSLYTGLKTVLSGNFNCASTAPFTTDVAEEKTRTDHYSAIAGFGKVALAQVAHAVFGHVAATAAITNDADFVTNMLADTSSANWDAIKASTQSAAVANLANALVKALVLKGFNGNDEYKDFENSTALTSIVNQVIGQDANRAKGQDNNAILPGVRQKLLFAAGDIVYMSITVQYPTITLSNASTALTPAHATGSESTSKFDLKITLV